MKIAVIINPIPAEGVSITAGKLDFGDATRLGPASRSALYLALKASDDVTAVATGELPAAEDALREALSYGTKQAILIPMPGTIGATDYTARAAVVNAAVEQLRPDLIICAAGSYALAPGSYAPTAPLLAGLLGYAYVGGVEAIRNDGGLQVVAREGAELVTYAVPEGTPLVLGVSNPDLAAHELPWSGDVINAYRQGEVTAIQAEIGDNKLTLSQLAPSPKREGREILTDPAEESAAVLVESLRGRSLI